MRADEASFITAIRATSLKPDLAKELATTSTKYTNVGPEPKRFSIGDGQLLEIAAASLPFAMRLGAGAFCVGYKTGLPQDDSSYGVLKISGRKLSETSSVANFPRPGKPLELYEFETCPFCKKVWGWQDRVQCTDSFGPEQSVT
ncbi:hypothetical protein QJQ45_007052 [Haematococcus lacustris]|nr:hypothetical protein QJQ45_007052 [Haematococcus lacustris]